MTSSRTVSAPPQSAVAAIAAATTVKAAAAVSSTRRSRGARRRSSAGPRRSSSDSASAAAEPTRRPTERATCGVLSAEPTVCKYPPCIATEEEVVRGRTPQEVFQHHAETLMAGDIDGIVSDYADDAVFITPSGVLRGKDGIREAFTNLLGDVPDAEWQGPAPGFGGGGVVIEGAGRGGG